MNVIFLDVDGVLNTVDHFTRNTERWRSMSRAERFPEMLEPELVERLKTLVTRSKTEVVLSSSWRLHPAGVEAVKSVIDILDCTPTLEDAITGLGWPLKMSVYYPRGAEIHAFLAQGIRARHDIQRYVILDDNPIVSHGYQRFDDLKYLNDHFVETNPGRGLTDEAVEAALRILGIENAATNTPTGPEQEQT